MLLGFTVILLLDWLLPGSFSFCDVTSMLEILWNVIWYFSTDKCNPSIWEIKLDYFLVMTLVCVCATTAPTSVGGHWATVYLMIHPIEDTEEVLTSDPWMLFTFWWARGTLVWWACVPNGTLFPIYCTVFDQSPMGPSKSSALQTE